MATEWASASHPQAPAKGRLRPLLTPRNPMHRSRVSNGREVLPNIDGRSVAARRIYDIASAIATDLGGADRLSETRLSLVRRFASLAVLAEEQESRLANGEQVDVAALAHISSTLVRLASRIGLKRVAKDITPTLAEILRGDDEPPRREQPPVHDR
jgi:hypothetical protein